MTTIRVTLATLGLTAMGYALWSAVRSPDLTIVHYGGYLLLVLVLHDGLLMPAVLVAATVLRRSLPDRVRALVQVALVASVVVTLIAVPLVLGYGRIADNPSALPRNYAHGLLLVLAAIWLAAATALAVRQARRRGGPAGRPRTPSSRTSRVRTVIAGGRRRQRVEPADPVVDLFGHHDDGSVEVAGDASRHDR
jgi:hypothetical protein